MYRSIRLNIAVSVLILAVCFLAQGHAQGSMYQLWETDWVDDGGNFGWSVAPMGNHVLVGQPLCPPSNVGRVLELDASSGNIINTYYGSLPVERLGISVAAVGDMDGDGVTDIVAGGRGNVTDYLGIVRVFLSQGSTIDPIRSPKAQPYDDFGCSVAGVGDVNGDGCPDFAVGACGEDVDGFLRAGRVYIYSGNFSDIRHGAPSPIYTLDPPDPQVGGFGYSVSKAGDLDDDGYADIFVGQSSTESGAAYVISAESGEELVTFGPGPPPFGKCVALLEPPARMNCKPKLAVGIPGDNGDAPGWQAVNLYNYDLKGTPFDQFNGADPKHFGEFVGNFGHSISGSAWITARSRWEFVVGSPDLISTHSATNAYVLRITPWGTLEHTGTIESPGTDVRRFGNGVAVTGRNWGYVAVGAPHAPDHGRAYGFEGEHTLAERDIEPVDNPSLHAQDEFLTTPATYILGPVLPNPFTESTTINYAVKEDGYASLRVFDLSGRLVRMLVDGTQSGGFHTATWDGCDDGGFQLPQGTYMYSLDVNGFSQSRKTILIR